jgi:fructose-bisphosphate aldolase class I
MKQSDRVLKMERCLVELIKNQGALPGIKVDKGLAPLESSPEETVTQGLDGLR